MLEINTELIARAQNGDTAVISALYEHYHLRVYRYLYYRVGNKQTAEDLTSEVFLRMLRFIGGFHPPSSSFQAWLFQIARNLANDHFRKTESRGHAQLEEEMTTTVADMDKELDRNLTSEGLLQALTKLTEEQRDVIVLRFVSGLPIAEVAQSLNKSEDAIKGLQRRGLVALREILSEGKVNYV